MKKNKKNKSSKKNQNIKNISMQEAVKAVGMIVPHQMLSEKLIVDRAMDELKELAEPMRECLIAARSNADLVRLYMERYIERIDCLLAVVDIAQQPEDEEDAFDDEYDYEYEEDDEC